MSKSHPIAIAALIALGSSMIGISTLAGTTAPTPTEESDPRLVMFVGIDISGSFIRSKHYDDALEFLSKYLYAHLKGIQGIEKVHSLFVGSLGGLKPNEPKTLYPIETFRNLSAGEIHSTLKRLFPRNVQNPFTDFNSFVDQIASTLEAKKLIMKPVSVILLSDGKPDLPGRHGEKGFKAIQFDPLENLSRNITIRLLYTDAVTAKHWTNQVPRKRVKMWTQDAVVMRQWRQKNITIPKRPLDQQKVFFDWIKENVDFAVSGKAVE